MSSGPAGVLQRWVPAVHAVRTYRRSWLRPDLVAGAVLAAILVPQGMAYAELAGLPAVTGLYCTIACIVGYALFGPSRTLVLGPDSSISPLILAAITPLLVTDDPAEAVAFAAMLALLVGLVELGLGLGKLGFVADLLSKEVQVGYMNGLGLLIVVGQLPKLFGFSTDADGFIEEIRQFLDGLERTNPESLVIGLATLAVLLFLPLWTRRIPAVLVAVVGATVVSAALDLSSSGVDTVGVLPKGVPTPSLPGVGLHDIGPLAAAALGIALVSLTDTIALSASLAARHDEEVDANQEMVGMGASNLFAGLFSGFAVSASTSRTMVGESAGARTQLAPLFGAGVVLLLLVAFNGLLQDLPQPTLAAVVISAAVSLIDLPTLRRFASARTSAFWLSAVASLAVIFLGVLPGIGVAVVLSVLMFFRRSWWPEGEVLGRDPATGIWHSLAARPDGTQREGVVVYRWEAQLFFANAGMFRERVRAIVREYRPDWVVLQCEAITDIDVTAADVLRDLDRELNDVGVHIAFVELRTRLIQRVERYGLHEELPEELFFDTLDGALTHILLNGDDTDDVPPEGADPLS